MKLELHVIKSSEGHPIIRLIYEISNLQVIFIVLVQTICLDKIEKEVKTKMFFYKF